MARRLPCAHGALRALLAACLAPALLGLSCSPAPAAREPGVDWRAHAALGPGFVVWESSRSGRWRIWQRRLDGSGLRQLSPDEGERDHFAPHIAPDGRRLAYLSYPPGQNPYRRQRRHVGVALHILDLRNGQDRILADDARSYFEDRAVVWIDADRLIYIAGDGSTHRIDIHTGQDEMLLPKRSRNMAYLIDATLGHATTGDPAFGAYDAQRHSVERVRSEGGCQPYFSHDGRWGFWEGAAGGPFRRIDLRSGKRGAILLRDDPRLPAEFGYLYFPMISAGQDLLAFGASRNEHDHFLSDYEIFVAPIDPWTLELTGKPQRYTFDPATDRFPDVFREGSELGMRRGEGPLHVRFEVPRDLRADDWRWDLGDGARASGPEVSHTYTRPGVYRLVARSREGAVLGGRVRVEPGQPPQPLETQVHEGGAEVTVRFDERIALGHASARFARSGPARSLEMAADGLTLRIQPAEPIHRADVLTLEGVVDRADPPHVMAARELAVEPRDWPLRSEGLVFLWRTGASANRVRDAATGTDRSYPLETRFGARLDRHYAMDLTGGGFRRESFAELATRLRASHAFSLELTLQAADLHAPLPGLIAGYAVAPDDRRFALMQEDDWLVFYLRTEDGPPGGQRFPLVRLSSPGPHHVVVTALGGSLAAYLDGKPVFDRRRLSTRMRDWMLADLSFGWERGGPSPWRGTLEGIALYDRRLDADEVAANARAYLADVASRAPVASVDVRVRRVAASQAPTVEEILPYRNALVLDEYEVLEVLDGDLGEPRIRVAHWALLNGEARPRAAAKPGEVLDLHLEPFSDHPEVQNLYLADDLPPDADVPLFLEPGS